MSYAGRCYECRVYTSLEVVRIRDRFGEREVYVCAKCKEKMKKKEGR